MSFIEGQDRAQISPLPPCVDDYMPRDAFVRIVSAFVASLDLGELGFGFDRAARSHAERARRSLICGRESI